MADRGVKKVIIPKESLPAIFGPTSQYVVRYRFVSDDKNRSSHWSPQYKISTTPVEEIQYSSSITQNGNAVSLVWEEVADVTEYDIFVSWDNGDWAYLSTVTNNNYTALKKAGATAVTFAVQVPSFPKKRYTASTLFETEEIDLVV